MITFMESIKDPPPTTQPSSQNSIDPHLWHACAGSMVQMPSLHSKVYYFPQGHFEHSLLNHSHTATCPRIPPLILCHLSAIHYLADPDSDEVFAKLLLTPLSSDPDYNSPLENDQNTLLPAVQDSENPASFAKTLTQSDARNYGGFSVPRYCAETIFPRLDYTADPPVQTVLAKDVHGTVWKFRHIYRGSPRRHLLTTGWSTFVNHKKLVAGDSIVFLRAENGELCVGIRRAKMQGWDGYGGGGFKMFPREDGGLEFKAKPKITTSIKSKLRAEYVMESAHLAGEGRPFEVYYYPRASTPEFCVHAGSVRMSMRTHWAPGMRFKMAFETEDSSRISWFMGTVGGVQVADPVNWPNSPWRLLQVNWDEPDLLQNVKRVSPWLVKLVSNIPSIHLAPFFPPRKKLCIPSMSPYISNTLKFHEDQKFETSEEEDTSKNIEDKSFDDDSKGKCILKHTGKGIDVATQIIKSELEAEMDIIITNDRPNERIHGRENDVKRMIELLVSHDDSGKENVRVIFVVAERGVGKNTLVQLVYNNQTVSDTFDTRIFVCMSEKFDEKKLMKAMIESVTCFPCDITEQSLLERILKEELTGKKCLLVFVNAQSEDMHFWDRVVAILSDVIKETVILVTTNNTVVTSTNGVVCLYSLNYLSFNTCWEIFKQHVFDGRDQNGHSELVNIGKCLVAQCGCIPLCVKVLGGLLKGKIDDKIWSSILESELWEIDKSEGKVLPALRVCYNFLHVNLKKCFEYCALFPKGYAYTKNHLVYLWMSQGFIEPSEGKELEEIGAEYFDKLVSISFFEQSSMNYGTFVMHPLVHDLAQFASRKEYFRSEDSLNNMRINVSHLSIVPYEFEAITLEPIIEEARNWRSFLIVNPQVFQTEPVVSPLVSLVKLNEMLLNLTHIATLDLSNTDIEELPDSIGSMKNLRYLGLNTTNLKNVPLEIGNLISLQTFEAKDCHYLIEIPETTKNLVNLRHLNLRKEYGYVGMSAGIGQLTNLQTLGTFNVGPDSSHCAIEELKHLNSLKGCLQIAGLENIANGMDSSEANLKDKASLETLSLHWGDVTEYVEDDGSLEVAKEVLNGLNPNYNLKEVTIRNYPGVDFPIWIEDSSFSNLVSVILDNCPNCTQFPSLSELTSLKHLSVQKMYNLQTMEISSQKSRTNGVKKFKSLETLSLWEMYGLKEMFEIEKADFPCLHTLSISRCPFLRKIPCFTSLLELSLHCCIEMPDISGFPSLNSLKIDGFPKIKSIARECIGS